MCPTHSTGFGYGSQPPRLSVFVLRGSAVLPPSTQLSHVGGQGMELSGIPEQRLFSMPASGDLNGDGVGDFALIWRGDGIPPLPGPVFPSLVTVVYGYSDDFPFPPGGRFRRGDANADGARSISDGIVILSHVFLGLPPVLACRKSGDVDDSGSLGLVDALYLLRILFLGDPIPVEPYIACGLDATTDGLECGEFPPCE